MLEYVSFSKTEINMAIFAGFLSWPSLERFNGLRLGYDWGRGRGVGGGWEGGVENSH